MMMKKLKGKMPSGMSKDLDLEDLKRMEMEEGPEDEAKESPEFQAMEDALGLEMHDEEKPSKSMKKMEPLKGISDDELMAELKKRGLMSKMEEEGEEEESEEYV